MSKMLFNLPTHNVDALKKSLNTDPNQQKSCNGIIITSLCLLSDTRTSVDCRWLYNTL